MGREGGAAGGAAGEAAGAARARAGAAQGAGAAMAAAARARAAAVTAMAAVVTATVVAAATNDYFPRKRISPLSAVGGAAFGNWLSNFGSPNVALDPQPCWRC